MEFLLFHYTISTYILNQLYNNMDIYLLCYQYPLP